MIGELFEHVLRYEPTDLDPALRERMAVVTKARGEYLAAASEVAIMRSRVWSGEKDLTDLAEIQAANFAKLREDYAQSMRGLVMEAVDLDSLAELVPMIVGGVLQSVKIPIPLLMEAIGLDIDQVKLLAKSLRDVFEEM